MLDRVNGRVVGRVRKLFCRGSVPPPGRSTLNLNFLGRDKTYQTLPVFSPAAPDIVFSTKPSQVAAGEFGLDADGNPVYREDGKIIKGENYTPPHLKDIVWRDVE